MSHILFTGKVFILLGRKAAWDEESPTCKFWGQPEVYSKVINNQNSGQNQSDTESYKAGKEGVAKKKAHTYLMMKNHALFRARQRPPKKILSSGRNEWQDETRAYG